MECCSPKKKRNDIVVIEAYYVHTILNVVVVVIEKSFELHYCFINYLCPMCKLMTRECRRSEVNQM